MDRNRIQAALPFEFWQPSNHETVPVTHLGHGADRYHRFGEEDIDDGAAGQLNLPCCKSANGPGTAAGNPDKGWETLFVRTRCSPRDDAVVTG